MPSENESLETSLDSMVESLGADLFGGGSDSGEETQPSGESLTGPSETQEAAATTEASPAQAPTTPPPATTSKYPDPPASWGQSFREGQYWQNTPEELRAEIHRREADAYKGLEQYKAGAARGRQLDEILAPYTDLMAQYNVDPIDQIKQVLRAHVALSTGPVENRAALIRNLAAGYGIDLTQAPASETADPAVASLQQQLSALQSKLDAQQRETESAKQAEAKEAVSKFMGDPKNEHASVVAPTMAELIKANPKLSLAEAYDQACWVVPAVREALIAKQQTEAAKKAAETERLNALKREKTSGHKVSSQLDGKPSKVPQTMEATLAATLADIQSRNR